MRIRVATTADLPSILQIEQSSSGAAHWPSSTYEGAILDSRRTVLVAEKEGRQVCGFLVTCRGLPEWELENIAVSPEFRRRGVGRLLVAQLIVQALEAGAEEVRQEIRSSNEPALKLACAMGFGVVGRRPNYYSDPQEDAVLLTLKPCKV